MRIFAVRLHRLGLLLALRGPDLVPAVLFHYPLHHVNGFGERARQLEEQVVGECCTSARGFP